MPTPPTVGVCATQGSAAVSIAVGVDPGFSDPIAFAVSGAPTGSTASVSPNPLAPPPGTVVLTVGNLGAATPGLYNTVVTATSGTESVPLTIPFSLNAASPGTPITNTPADGAVGVSNLPTLTWAAAGDANTYLVELATDINFSNLVSSSTVTGTSYAVTTPLAGATTYYWRVTASNHCGTGSQSIAASFRTALAPGLCEIDQSQTTVFLDHVDAGINGWTTTGSVGPSTWVRSTARPNSGTHAWYANNIA